MKKIMILGGNVFQSTVIKRAKELGYYVISVDYLPDNPGHKFSDEYHNISIVDKENVLALAKKLNIDGILAYASDIAAPTAAYVSEQLNLPTNPYKSVMILTHKNLFRSFMKDNNFLAPDGGKSFSDREKAREYLKELELPVMIKPVDSSGSKGVTKIMSPNDFEAAFDEAMSYSISKEIIMEHFIQKAGYRVDGEGFIKDGKIAFFGVMDQHNNVECNPYPPIGSSYPSIQAQAIQQKAKEIVQSIFDKLGMRFGGFNSEYIVDDKGEIYLLEIGPRHGGNFIPDTIKTASGIDMIEASIRACVGDKYDETFQKRHEGIATSYAIHSLESGVFESLKVHPDIEKRIVKQALNISPGDSVNAFRNGGDSIGCMVLRFDNIHDMNEKMDQMWKYVEVVLRR